MSQEERLKVVCFITALVMVVIFVFSPTGQATGSNIEPGDVIITEIMANPKLVSDSVGEWFEIYNQTDQDIDLTNCEFSDNGSNHFTISELIIPATTYLVLARNDNPEENGGLISDYTYTGYTLANTEDAIIFTCQTIEIDRVEYSTSLDFVIPDGASLMLKDINYDNNIGNSWCTSNNSYGDGDQGTPQAINGTCADLTENNQNVITANNRPPLADAGQDQNGLVGQTIYFDGSNSSDPDNDTLTYSWDFGDGQKSSGKTVSHVYQQNNVYLVTLTVADGKVAQTDSLTVSITQPATTNFVNKLLISELMPNPEGPDDDEWIELYNQSNLPVDLTGLILVDASNKKYILSTDDFASLIIPAKEFFLVPRAISKISLNNTPPETIKITLPNNELITTVTYTEAVQEGWSLIFYDNEYYWTTTPTPGYANNLNQPRQDTTTTNQPKNSSTNDETETIIANLNQDCQPAKNDQLILNELLPSPQGDDRLLEFIEIKNASHQPANLCGWSISDPTRQHFFPTEIVIPPLSFYLIEPANSRLSLNNQGDQISLYGADDELVDFTSYGKAGVDWSWSRFTDNSWQWTKNISPGEENIFSEKDIVSTETNNSTPANNNTNEYNFISLEEINQTQANDKIIVTGIVTAEPGRLGAQIMYIMNLAGLQIYQHFQRWPALTIGDRVEIRGTMSFPSGQPRLKVQAPEDIFILEKNQSAKLAWPVITTDELSDESIGSLVTINGTAVEIKKSSLVLADDQGEINLVIKPSTEIKLPPITEGDILEATGIIDKTTAGWRLLPRYEDDIKILTIQNKNYETQNFSSSTQTTTVKTNSNFINYLYLTFFSLIIFLSGSIYKLKKQYGYTNNQKAN